MSPSVTPDPHQDIPAAAERLAQGGLVAFPTETVYGLGARADDDDAVARIFVAKGRPSDHPLIVHVASVAAAHSFAAQIGPLAATLIQHCWPGPLTLIVPRLEGRGTAAAAGQMSIGLRMPAHPLALALLRAAAALGVAGVAAPSANRFGRISPTAAAHVREEFGPQLMVLDGGPCEVGIESTIIDCTRPHPVLLRPGQLDRRALEALLGQPLQERDALSPRAPGTLEAHYAPLAKLRLMPSAQLAQALATPGEMPSGALAVYSRSALPPRPGLPGLPGGVLYRPMPTDSAQAARELFAALRGFDAAGVTQIWVETPPLSPEWEGVTDRLQRAAAN